MMLVFGALNLDLVFPVASLPQTAGTIWAEGGGAFAGGKGANQAVAAQRDGARVRLAGLVGRDPLGAMVLTGLRQEGIDVSLVLQTASAVTGRTAICVTPDGHTAVTVADGANALATAAQIDDPVLARARTLLVQLGTDPAEVATLILRARALGLRVILNVAPARAIDADALRAADVLIGNAEEIATLGMALGTGRNAASVQNALGAAVVRMMGVQGIEAAWAESWCHMPALPVQMRDTTAAADCACGVFAGALAHGAPMEAALRRAAVGAALSTTAVGSGSTAPRREDIDRALRQAPEVSHVREDVPD